jgi:hypothetical protein
MAENRQSLIDPDYKGEDYFIDPELRQGPLTNRRCTDLLCLIIFIAAIVAGGYVGYFSAKHGNPELLVAPLDADGDFCGKSVGYEKFPVLYYSKIDSLYWGPYSVCASRCPTVKTPLTSTDCILTENVKECAGSITYDTYNFFGYCMPVYDTLP